MQAPCIVFLDEIDAITPKRDTAQREMERRIVAQLLTSMDSMSEHNVKTKKVEHQHLSLRLVFTPGKVVLIIGATNRPEALDPALRRAGRFDREICLGVPNLQGRCGILKVLCNGLRLSDEVNLDEIARLTPGYVGADLSSLIKEAAAEAVSRIFSDVLGTASTSSVAPTSLSQATSRTNDQVGPVSPKQNGTESQQSVAEQINVSDSEEQSLSKITTPFTPEQLEPLKIQCSDFLAALKKVQPSAKREGLVLFSL